MAAGNIYKQFGCNSGHKMSGSGSKLLETRWALYRDGSSCVDPVLSKDQCVLLEDTMQAWTRNSSVSSEALYHRATAPPFAVGRKNNPVIPDKIVYTG